MALTPINLSNLLTFTTDPDGTRVNAAGLIEQAVTNQPRFDFHPTTGQFLGILFEEARTNHLLRSQEFDNASWTKTRATITANATTAPDGTLTADKLVENTESNSHWMNGVVSVVSGTVYTFSVYLKAADRAFAALQLATAFSTSPTVYIDLTTGATSISSGTPTIAVTGMVNGWWRLSITDTATSTASASARVFIASALGTAGYLGNGVSGIYVWGAQLEVGNVESSYIPTTTAAVGRSADLATIPVASISSFNLTEGTFVATADTYDPASDCTVFAANNGTQNEQFDARFTITSIACRVRKAGVNEVSKGVSDDPVANTPYKIALAYKLNDTHVMVNGTSDGTPDTSCAMPTGITTLEFGARTASSFLNGHIKSLTYYPTRLTDTELEQVTTL